MQNKNLPFCPGVAPLPASPEDALSHGLGSGFIRGGGGGCSGFGGLSLISVRIPGGVSPFSNISSTSIYDEGFAGAAAFESVVTPLRGLWKLAALLFAGDDSTVPRRPSPSRLKISSIFLFIGEGNPDEDGVAFAPPPEGVTLPDLGVFKYVASRFLISASSVSRLESVGSAPFGGVNL